MKKLLIGMLALGSISAYAVGEKDVCKISSADLSRLEDDSQSLVKETLIAKGYTIDRQSNIELKVFIFQSYKTAETLATMTWINTNSDFGSIKIHQIEGKTLPSLSIIAAYQNPSVDFEARRERALKRMLNKLPNCNE